jgi:hypothetical protein
MKGAQGEQAFSLRALLHAHCTVGREQRMRTGAQGDGPRERAASSAPPNAD